MLCLPYEQALADVEWVDRKDMSCSGGASDCSGSQQLAGSTRSRGGSASSARSDGLLKTQGTSMSPRRVVNALPLRTLAEAMESLRRRRLQRQEAEGSKHQDNGHEVPRVPFPVRLWSKRELCQRDHDRRDLPADENEECLEEEAPRVLEDDELADLVERLTKPQRAECVDKSSCALPPVVDRPIPETERRLAQPEATARLSMPKKPPEPSPRFVIPPLDEGDVECLVDRLHSEHAAGTSSPRCSSHLAAIVTPRAPRPKAVRGAPKEAAPSSVAVVTKRLYDVSFYEKRNRHGHFQGDGYTPMSNAAFMLLPRPPQR